MSRRPFPVCPRGAGRRRDAPKQIVVGVPRDCPMWKIQAMRALFKPQLKGAILHRRATTQRWTREDRAVVDRALSDLRDRLDGVPEIHFPAAGEFWMIATCDREQIDLARSIAIVLSRRLPRRWIVVDQLMVSNERFYRRGGRFNLVLKRARDIHLPRAMRAIIGNRPHEKSSDPS